MSVVRPFGRRLGQWYPCACPGCEHRFVLENHKQEHCSPKCRKTALLRRRASHRYARMGNSASVVKNGSTDAHFTGVSRAGKADRPPEWGSAGWEARCEREMALAQDMAAAEASRLSAADRAELAFARAALRPEPPALECQYCGADLAKTHHVLTCRVIVDVDTLEIPSFLDRRAARRETI